MPGNNLKVAQALTELRLGSPCAVAKAGLILGGRGARPGREVWKRKVRRGGSPAAGPLRLLAAVQTLDKLLPPYQTAVALTQPSKSLTLALHTGPGLEKVLTADCLPRIGIPHCPYSSATLATSQSWLEASLKLVDDREWGGGSLGPWNTSSHGTDRLVFAFPEEQCTHSKR